MIQLFQASSASALPESILSLQVVDNLSFVLMRSLNKIGTP